MKTLKIALAAILLAVGLTACNSKADTASRNLSTAADNFEIQRQIVFYNGITGDYIAEFEGRCSLGNYDSSRRLSVTCKVGPDAYEKHFLGLSDNVTYFALQSTPAKVNVYRTRIIWRPSTIVPDPEFDNGF